LWWLFCFLFSPHLLLHVGLELRCQCVWPQGWASAGFQPARESLNLVMLGCKVKGLALHVREQTEKELDRRTHSLSLAFRPSLVTHPM
jgi:hypothetical protein